MPRLLTNNSKSFIRFYDYPIRLSALPPSPPQASILFTHATGFHGHTFNKTINFLTPDRYACYTFDQRGHGHSPWPDDAPINQLSNWDGFGDDALAMTKYVYKQHMSTSKEVGGVLGVGHSQGATALLLAALKEPQMFSALILYEPVVFPKLWRNLSGVFFRFSESPLAVSSRKRRMEFDSLDEAFLNFASKPPMNNFHLDVLRDYVRYGTEKVEEGSERRRLLCHPNVEAMIYNSVHLHHTWDLLPQLQVPVWIVSGKVDRLNVSGIAKRIHEQIPNSKYVLWDDCSHFGPMEMPSKLADLIEEVVLVQSIDREAKEEARIKGR
jgi:pimeloyl-ACP methyl ester carboxylesterase